VATGRVAVEAGLISFLKIETSNLYIYVFYQDEARVHLNYSVELVPRHLLTGENDSEYKVLSTNACSSYARRIILSQKTIVGLKEITKGPTVLGY
jgi:hypothetical protein